MSDSQGPLNWADRQAPLAPGAVPVTPPGMDYSGYTHGPWMPAQHLAPPPPPRRKRPVGLIVALAAAGLVMLAGASVVGLALLGHSPVPVPGVAHTITVKGTLTINNGCDSWGYSDITTGTEVTITDEAGKVLAVGRLTGGGASCTWYFTVDNVPAGAKFYGITISHRGTLHYTEDQLRGGVQMSIG